MIAVRHLSDESELSDASDEEAGLRQRAMNGVEFLESLTPFPPRRTRATVQSRDLRYVITRCSNGSTSLGTLCKVSRSCLTLAETWHLCLTAGSRGTDLSTWVPVNKAWEKKARDGRFTIPYLNTPYLRPFVPFDSPTPIQTSDVQTSSFSKTPTRPPPVHMSYSWMA